jgi:hypothetical protein
MRSTSYTMEGVTSARLKVVGTRPFMDVLVRGVDSDVSSVTENTTTYTARAGVRPNVAMYCVANDLNTIVQQSQPAGDVNNEDDDNLAGVELDDDSMGKRNDNDWAANPVTETEMMAETPVRVESCW